MGDKAVTQKEIQGKINTLTSNMIRHDGNVLELEKQYNQVKAELDYEKQQSKLCFDELQNLYPLLKTDPTTKLDERVVA